ncbi:zinc metalloprotease HtpX [Candidatus Omnitrophota bacterium]
MFLFKLRMWLLLTALFGIIYMVIVIIGSAMGVVNFYFYILMAFGFMFIQYMLGPKLVEWSMRVKYVKRNEYPRLYEMVEEMAGRANMPVPRIGIAQIEIPNAFAFGRSVSDGRVCVTQGLLKLLNEEELRAVLGHELSHLKNRDVLTITMLSVIPMVMYWIAWNFLFYGRRRSSGQNTALIGLAALLFYFITNLLVLYASRIREYFADRGSLLLGNKPSAMASSLYKLVYGSARMNKESLKRVEGFKAFFANDPSRAQKELTALRAIDLDNSGTLDCHELEQLSNKRVHLTFGDKLLEALSTHPNMLARIKQLSEYRS